jgi:hypothetical protein
MYIRERESGVGSALGAAAAAAAAPVGISVGAVLTAIALVVSAILVAYGLIKAYELAQERGIGVAYAARMLSAGLGRLIALGRRALRVGNFWLELFREKFTKRGPRCEGMLAALARVMAAIAQLIAQIEAEKNATVPRHHVIRGLMDQLKRKLDLFKDILLLTIRICGGELAGQLGPGSVRAAVGVPRVTPAPPPRAGQEQEHVRRTREPS